MVASSEERYQKAMDMGHSAAWDKDWSKAAAYYQQALDEKPNDPKALSNLALALYEMQEYEDALRLYLELAKTTPDDPVPLEKASLIYQTLGQNQYASQAAFKAAEAHIAQKNIDRAIEFWTRTVNLDPEHLNAHSRLALVYDRMGKKDQAVREYLHVASLMQHKGKLEKAVQAVNRAIQISPTSDEAHQALDMLRQGMLLPKPARPKGGTDFLGLPERESAPQLNAPSQEADTALAFDPVETALKKALSELATKFFEQSNEMGGAVNQRGDLQNIMQGTGPLRLQSADTARLLLHVSQAVDLQMRGEYAMAAEELKRAVDAGLQDTAVAYDLGYLLYKGGRYKTALKHLQYAAQDEQYSLGARLLMGKLYCSMQKWQDAAVSYLEALKLADSSVVGDQHADALQQYYEPVIEAMRVEKQEDVLRELCESVDDLLMRAKWKAHLKNVREQLLEQEEAESPRPLVEVLIEAKNSQIVDAITQVRTLARRGNLRAALEEAFFALEFAPDYLPLHALIAELLLEEGNIEGAVNKYMMMAKSYQVRGETARAIEMLRKAIQISPMEVDARNRLIDILRERGDYEGAIDEYISLAEIYYSMAELNKARQAYSDALRLAAKGSVDERWRIRLLHRLADINLQSLDWRHAMDIYSQILQVAPGDKKAVQRIMDLDFRLGQREHAIKVLNNYTFYMIKQGKYSDIFAFLEALEEERPDEPEVHRCMAHVLAAEGNISEAIQKLDQAGELYLEQGDNEQGIKVIHEIISLNPPNVEDYQQLLVQLSSNLK